MLKIFVYLNLWVCLYFSYGLYSLYGQPLENETLFNSEDPYGISSVCMILAPKTLERSGWVCRGLDWKSKGCLLETHRLWNRCIVSLSKTYLSAA